MFDRENKSINFLEAQKELASLPDEKAIKKMTTYEGALGFTLAYGAAIAPHPELGPPFFDYPMQDKNGELQKIPAIWTRWENGIGGWRQKIEKYHANLEKLSGITIDYGTEDALEWIPVGSEYVSNQLSKAGINHQILHFKGGHSDHIKERLLNVMLPFFDTVLVDPS